MRLGFYGHIRAALTGRILDKKGGAHYSEINPNLIQPPEMIGADLSVHDSVKSDRTSFEACERVLVEGSTTSRGRQKKAAIQMLGNFF
ncbi:hypothetical protein [Rhizobium leguminosarum]|uniref:hypothetical protein n=1 Tax=Rhizobium leguminosarum TaxID=384 RepID=UPI001C95702A|nr:hypothetical protein [Rhizobium leguminosarum]MBY5660435.1 hypothetical protein [Rhizobium leguminosarum]MBY5674058.1 hypothetical protein [Rhizobium leguminosarum]